jgi:hypothetical protein
MDPTAGPAPKRPAILGRIGGSFGIWRRLMARLRALAANLAVLLASVIAFLTVCEIVVFRLVWVASDVPATAFVDGVVRHAPNQSGIWRVQDEIAAPHRINGQGWNSGIGDYSVARRPGVPRIAIVGDSFVEAFQVRYDRSVGERLAANLGRDGGPVEVYRFGISGAPLSQYLQIIEHEVVRYRPDWIVVVIIHNDFGESYKFQSGRYTSSFLKLRVEAGRVTGEIPPVPWRSGTLDWLRANRDGAVLPISLASASRLAGGLGTAAGAGADRSQYRCGSVAG